MKICISPYQLKPSSQLNHLHSKKSVRDGVLLKIKFDDGLIGYSDFFPFQALGDIPIEEHLKSLYTNDVTDHLKLSISYARQDAIAREQCISCYTERKIKNHFLITSLQAYSFSQIDDLVSLGFDTFKFKLAGDLEKELLLLKELLPSLDQKIKVRLDFNERFSFNEFRKFLDKITDWLGSYLEFIEDPFSYNEDQWIGIQKDYRICLALDMAEDVRQVKRGFDYIVLKPAIQQIDSFLEHIGNKKVVITHYMDSAIGQMIAFSEAQKAFDKGVQIVDCGLLSSNIFDDDQFSLLIKESGPYLVPPPGKGYGFDDVLKGMSWNKYL